MESKRVCDIIPNVTFIIHQFDAITALKLERKINLIFLPAVGGFLGGKDLVEIANLESQVNLQAIFDGFISGLEKIPDFEYENLILQLVSKIQVEIPGKPPREMNLDVFNEVFKGNLLSVYKLIFEVMKINRFSFFELVDMVGGLGIFKTNFSNQQSKNKKK